MNIGPIIVLLWFVLGFLGFLKATHNGKYSAGGFWFIVSLFSGPTFLFFDFKKD